MFFQYAYRSILNICIYIETFICVIGSLYNPNETKIASKYYNQCENNDKKWQNDKNIIINAITMIKTGKKDKTIYSISSCILKYSEKVHL